MAGSIEPAAVERVRRKLERERRTRERVLDGARERGLEPFEYAISLLALSLEKLEERRRKVSADLEVLG